MGLRHNPWRREGSVLYDIYDLTWIDFIYINELENYVKKVFGTIHGDVKEAYVDRQVPIRYM